MTDVKIQTFTCETCSKQFRRPLHGRPAQYCSRQCRPTYNQSYGADKNGRKCKDCGRAILIHNSRCYDCARPGMRTMEPAEWRMRDKIGPKGAVGDKWSGRADRLMAHGSDNDSPNQVLPLTPITSLSDALPRAISEHAA